MFDDELADLEREEAASDAFFDAVEGDYSDTRAGSFFGRIVDYFGGHKTQEEYSRERSWEKSHGFSYFED